MRLRAFTRIDSGVAVIELDGNITLGEGSSLLRASIEQALAQGYKSILIDFEGVDYIDSSGLGELVACNPLAGANGARIKLVNLQKRVHGVMQLTKLVTIFETFEDENVAVKSFRHTNSAQV